MTDSTMPSMQTLAPLVDELQAIAREEIPSPRTCRIYLYDDHTYRITIEHTREDGSEAIVYDRVTGEVKWRDSNGARQRYVLDPAYGDVIRFTYFMDDAETVVTAIEPPIDCEPVRIDCDTAPNGDTDPLMERFLSE